MSISKDNIKKLTIKNTYYRKVIATTKELQLVLMCLKPKEDIGMEVHPKTTQFIRIEKGTAKVIINKKKCYLKDDDFIIIPSGKKHNVINKSKNDDLKLYSIYSPPIHKSNTKEKYKK